MEQTLGNRISDRRKGLGLTQDQLAEKLGVTAQAVSKWENDQSCPDITTLPKLADIFGITIDELLGRTGAQTVHTAIIMDDDFDDDDDDDNESGFTFKYDNSRRSGIGFGVFVLLTGVLWLASKILAFDVGFWGICIPCALVVFGIMGLYPKFSVFRLGSAVFGAWWLLSSFRLLPAAILEMELLIPAMLVVLGLGLVVDSLRKPQKPMFSFSYNKDGKEVGTEELSTGSNSFEFKASFTQADRTVSLSQLQRGSIHTSFGDYTVDLSGVKSVGPNCFLEIHNSFGNLDLLVPRRYQVVSENSAGFASIEIDSNPDGSDGIIHLETHCSFGQVDVTYI